MYTVFSTSYYVQLVGVRLLDVKFYEVFDFEKLSTVL